MKVYLVTSIYDQDEKINIVFKSIESAREWLKKIFWEHAERMNFPEKWVVNRMNCNFPINDTMFSVENLIETIECDKRSDSVYSRYCIWGPVDGWTDKCPLEYFIEEVELHE